MTKIYVENSDNSGYTKKRTRYLISNEYLKPTAKFLTKLSGFDFYDGVCGGGTQNLYLLQILHKKNKFKRITLIDYEESQLKNFKRIVGIYNSTSAKNEYQEKILNNYQIRMRFLNWLNYLTKAEIKVKKLNLKKPVFYKDIRIKLVNSDFNDYIKSINIKGKYFIYASNLCNFNPGSKVTKRIKDFCYSVLYCINLPNRLINFVKASIINEMSKSILENKSILDGSILFAVGPAAAINQPYPTVIIIFEKQNNKLEIIKEYLQK